MAFKVNFEVEIPSGLEKGVPAQIVREEAMRTIGELLPIINNRMREQSQFGGTNALRTGWTVRGPRFDAELGGVSGEVGNPTVQATVIDEGANPHFPPVGPVGGQPALGVWIRRVLGITNPRDIRRKAFVIGRAIQRRGLPGRTSQKGKFSRTFRALGGVIAAFLGDMNDQIKKRIEED